MANLPDLTQHIPLVDKHGRPTFEFKVFWDTFKTNIQSSLNELIITDTNIIPNSYLSEDAIGWKFDTGVSRIENALANEPPVSIKAVSGATGNVSKYAYASKHEAIYVKSEQQYVIEFSLKGSNALLGSNASVGVQLDQYDASGTLLSVTQSADVATTSWATSSGAFTTEKDTAYVKVKVYFSWSNDVDQTTTDTLEIANLRVYSVDVPATIAAGARYKFTGAITATCDAAGTTLTLETTAGTLYAGKGVSYNAMSASRSVVSGIEYTIYLYVNVGVFKSGAHTLEHTEFDYIPYFTPNNFYVGKVTITTGPNVTAAGVLGGGNNQNYP